MIFIGTSFRLAAARRFRKGNFQGPRKLDEMSATEEKATNHIHDPDVPGRLVLYRPTQFDK